MECVVAVVHGIGFDFGLSRDEEQLQRTGVGSTIFLLSWVAESMLVDLVTDFGREW